MKVLKAIGLFVMALLVLLALPLLLPKGEVERRTAVPDSGMPWQIEAAGDGFTRVFGIEPGRTPFGAARDRLGGAPLVALVAATGGSGSLEAYWDSFSAGPLMGKLVLTLDTSLEQREEMLQRAVKAEYMEGTTRRVTMTHEDLARAETLPILAVTFIPSAHLDEEIILRRFGAPGERIRASEHREHFLYPDKGLDLQLDAKGKEVLQYVAPRDFERLLHEPLRAKPR